DGDARVRGRAVARDGPERAAAAAHETDQARTEDESIQRPTPHDRVTPLHGAASIADFPGNGPGECFVADRRARRRPDGKSKQCPPNDPWPTVGRGRAPMANQEVLRIFNPAVAAPMGTVVPRRSRTGSARDDGKTARCR